MREILFRGKRVDNGKWVEGSLYYDPDLEQSQIYGFNYTYNSETGEERECFHHLVDYNTVGQYTGLTANGKEIFEGDIVKYKNTDGISSNGVILTITGKVVYNKKTASFAVDGSDKIGAKHFDYFPIKKIEVIGNIHDNPELLKGESNNEL